MERTQTESPLMLRDGLSRWRNCDGMQAGKPEIQRLALRTRRQGRLVTMGNTLLTAGSIREVVLRELHVRSQVLDSSLRILRKFDMDVSGTSGFVKMYFGISCSCSTAAVLSLEVAQNKTVTEVQEAVPALVDRLLAQERVFKSMSCEAHRRMRVGWFQTRSNQDKEAEDAEA